MRAARVLDGAFRESLEGAAPPKLPAVSRTRRPYLSAVTKKAVAAAQKWRCAKCGKLLDGSFEIDHRVPLSRGGDNSIENLQALHRFPCHMAKSATDARAKLAHTTRGAAGVRSWEPSVCPGNGLPLAVLLEGVSYFQIRHGILKAVMAFHAPHDLARAARRCSVRGRIYSMCLWSAESVKTLPGKGAAGPRLPCRASVGVNARPCFCSSWRWLASPGVYFHTRRTRHLDLRRKVTPNASMRPP